MNINLSVLETAPSIFRAFGRVLVDHQACAQQIPCAIFLAFRDDYQAPPDDARPPPRADHGCTH